MCGMGARRERGGRGSARPAERRFEDGVRARLLLLFGARGRTNLDDLVQVPARQAGHRLGLVARPQLHLVRADIVLQGLGRRCGGLGWQRHALVTPPPPPVQGAVSSLMAWR